MCPRLPAPTIAATPTPVASRLPQPSPAPRPQRTWETRRTEAPSTRVTRVRRRMQHAHTDAERPLLADDRCLMHQYLHEQLVCVHRHAWLLRLAHVPLQACRHIAHCHLARAGVERSKEQRHCLALRCAQPALTDRFHSSDHAVAH
eukprot:scaffold72489_cov75-Phaeocystis_antarctica.AAC.5